VNADLKCQSSPSRKNRHVSADPPVGFQRSLRPGPNKHVIISSLDASGLESYMRKELQESWERERLLKKYINYECKQRIGVLEYRSETL